MTEQRSKIYTKAVELSDMMGLSAAEEANLQSILDIFPMAIPQYYLSLIDWNDPDDPIRRMCIPSLTEIDISGDFDTSGEADNTVVTGLQHKYQQTALILSTNRCAMYCRHCFRKRLVGSSEEEIADNFDAMLDYIKAHPEITNILVSGGDSLMLSNATLEKYLCELTALPQLDFIRFGSRVPVVYPERILRDEELQAIFAKYAERKQLYLVTQFNHPRELTAEAKAVIKIFIKAGVVLRNQTVLLRGVNDDPQVLGQLLRELTAVGVSPYYIFQCRPVRGVKAQFQVPLQKGLEVVELAKGLQNGVGKCLRYCMSTPRGKVEIVGKLPDNQMLFKYNQAKDGSDAGRIFVAEVQPDQCWLELNCDD